MSFDIAKYLDREINLKNIEFDGVNNKGTRFIVKIDRNEVQRHLEEFMLHILNSMQIEILPDKKGK